MSRYFRKVGLRLTLGVLAVAGLQATPAYAQTGGLRIAVVETSGTPIRAAVVVLSNSRSLIKEHTSSVSKDGLVEYAVLPAGGGYAIRVSAPGYVERAEMDLRIVGSSTVELTISLIPVAAEKLSVYGRSAVVDLTQVGASTRFTDEFIELLPQRGRQYQDLLPRAPGVLDEDADGNPNVHGARTRDFRAEIGGISNVDPLTGQWLSQVNLDSIEELEMLPFGAGVGFGRAQGGFARIAQKTGTNDFEGVFSALYRSSKLDGDGAGRILGPAPDFETFQPSLLLAGPIVKDRVWFRAAHEWMRHEDPVNLFGNLAVSTRRQTIAADQLTWQASPRNRLTFQYQNDPLRVENLGLSSRVPPESSQTFDRRGSTVSLGWLAPISPRLLFDGTVAYQDHSHDLVPTALDLAQHCVQFVNIPGLETARCQRLDVDQFAGSHNETSLDDRQRFTVRLQSTVFTRIGSHSHRLLFGLLAENERYARELDRGPLLELEGPQFADVLDTGGDLIALGTFRIWNPRQSEAYATGNSFAWYVEDQWKPHATLGITFGLRFDREEIDAPGWRTDDPRTEAGEFYRQLGGTTPVDAITRRVFTGYEDPVGFRDDVARLLGLPTSVVRLSPEHVQSAFWVKRRRPDFIHLVNENLSPRLSVAWDPGGDGKTKVALSAGRYHDKTFLAVPLVEVEPYETRNSFVANVRAVPEQGSLDIFTNLFYMTVNPLSVRLLDRDLQTPYQDELALSVERQVFAETALRASYIRRRFRDQFQDIDINHQAGDHGRCTIDVSDDPDLGRLRQGVVVPSPGTGPVPDPFTGQPYEDIDPGPGDGVIDDCLGNLQIYSPKGLRLDLPYDLPDGRPDLYVQNPAWEEILYVGNFNRSDYEAVVVEFVRRLYRNWQLQASYTWSRAQGDAEDFDLLLGNESTLREDESGYLDYDRTHVFKVDATGHVRGFRLGGSVTWQSGLPYSVVSPQTVGFTVPPAYPFRRTTALRSRLRYPSGQRNDQRNSRWFNLDLRVARAIALGKGRTLELSVDVFNALNDGTLQIESVTTDRRRITSRNDVPAPDAVAGTRRFGRRWQIGTRLSF